MAGATFLTTSSSPARTRTWSSRVTVGRAATSTSEDTYPRQESNLRLRLRTPVSFPLDHRGVAEDAGFEPARRSRADHRFRDGCLTGLGQSSRCRDGGRACRPSASCDASFSRMPASRTRCFLIPNEAGCRLPRTRKYPCQESNLNLGVRSAALFPLSYKGEINCTANKRSRPGRFPDGRLLE